ncbi:MAG TPA: HipA domain-containing protein, partial [Planctomycetota bacterium]|nr:HipA domain-containing protein [Planctomycetota bacterium]
PADAVRLLRDHSGRPEEDVATFVDALAFLWLIGGTDGHAKNYSLLHAAGGRVRLAPLYDLASVLPYPSFDARRVKLAMRIGSKYRLEEIRRRQWEELARELKLDGAGVVARIASMADRAPEAAAEIRDRLVSREAGHPIVARLAKLISDRARHCARLLRE